MPFCQSSVNRQRALFYSQMSACAMAMLLIVCPYPAEASQEHPHEQSAVTMTFTNNAGVIVADPYPDDTELAVLTKGDPYPSTIKVCNFASDARILSVSVILHNVTHEYLDDFDILLVSPKGEQVILVSNVSGLGAGTSVSNLNWRIDDTAAQPLRDSNNNTGVSMGVTVPEWVDIWTDTSLRSYKPSDYDGEFATGSDDPLNDFFDLRRQNPNVQFDTPLGMSVFNDTSPNGTWRLYVADDYAGFSGSLGGWSLEITAIGSCPCHDRRGHDDD